MPARRYRWPIVAALVVVLLPVLYVLSLGPILWATARGWVSEETCNALIGGPFRPLEGFYYEGDGWIADVYRRWMNWWWK